MTNWRPSTEADAVIPAVDFPERFLRDVRERTGIRLGEAARRLNLSVIELSAIELGKATPRVSTVRAMEVLYKTVLVRDDMGPGGAA